MAGPDPYLTFSAREWAAKGDGASLDLSEAEVLRLRSLGDHLDLDEVRRIYLPLSRLLSDHVEAMQGLFAHRKKFLDIKGRKTPFVIGIAGSVAVGKSTTARVLQDLMRRWPSSPNVALVTTDGFLLPNKTLSERDLMTRKGFPESYDRKALIRFLADIKAGRSEVHAPRYSHLVYDIVEGEQITVSAPDILIFEGLNVLQNPPLEDAGDPTPVASDYFDFSIYVDAAADLIETWYISRFMSLRETAFADPASFFHTYAGLSDKEARATAERLWNTINLVNLTQNIRPTRARASMVLRKGENHRVEQVRLRRL